MTVSPMFLVDGEGVIHAWPGGSRTACGKLNGTMTVQAGGEPDCPDCRALFEQ